jgi:hypothetical protein
MLDPTQPGPLLAILLQKAHIPQFLQHLALDLFAERVCIWVERGEAVGELAQGAGEGVVFLVVEGSLEMVAAADGGFAVRGVGFVGVEVDFAEKSVEREWGGRLVGFNTVGKRDDGELFLVMLEFSDHLDGRRGLYCAINDRL